MDASIFNEGLKGLWKKKDAANDGEGKGRPEGVKFQTGGDGDLQLIGKLEHQSSLSPLLPLASCLHSV